MGLSENSSLYTMVIGIDHMDPAEAIEYQGPRIVQLPRPASLRSPTVNGLSIERKFLHAVIAILANVDVALPVEC